MTALMENEKYPTDFKEDAWFSLMSGSQCALLAQGSVWEQFHASLEAVLCNLNTLMVSMFHFAAVFVYSCGVRL